jgi:nickel/cobalt exporter
MVAGHPWACLRRAWALKRLGRKEPHTHWHAHADGEVHTHEHTHRAEHAHVHTAGQGARSTSTAWSLFIIFVFGPCEAFIPLLLFPAFQQNGQLAISTTLVFAIATIGTMMATVYLLSSGSGVRFPQSRSPGTAMSPPV